MSGLAGSAAAARAARVLMEQKTWLQAMSHALDQINHAYQENDPERCQFWTEVMTVLSSLS